MPLPPAVSFELPSLQGGVSSIIDRQHHLFNLALTTATVSGHTQCLALHAKDGWVEGAEGEADARQSWTGCGDLLLNDVHRMFRI